MKLKEIFEYINSFAPFSTQADFDNAGFLVGDENAEFSGGIVALDITDGAIEFAKKKGANLIVTHHPVIFEPLKSVTAESLVYKLIKNDISVISAHTNLDMAEGGINDTLCKILELENVSGIIPSGDCYEARIGELEALTPDEFGNYLSGIFSGSVKYVCGNRSIKRVAVCSGSGGSLLKDVAKSGADAFVTADVKHNVFLDASHLGISLYDCGHFDTEDIIISPLKVRLQEKFGNFSEYHSDIIKSVLQFEE